MMKMFFEFFLTPILIADCNSFISETRYPFLFISANNFIVRNNKGGLNIYR